MNDPGLHEPIQHSVNEAERKLQSQLRRLSSSEVSSSPSSSSSSSQSSHELSAASVFRRELRRKDNSDDEKDYFQPKRWWFTSTAFPLIAGTFGPLANLYSVCALVQDWRVRFTESQGETKGEMVSDPGWLIAVNSVSLAFAIVANLLLLLNFAHRVPYRIAQPLTIIFWYISSITLIALVIASVVHLRPIPHENHAFTQSFYYGIISAILYFIISTLLAWNMIGAYYFKAYKPSFTSLTMAQRTLMLQTISYSFYLALGAGVFSRIEGWEFVDGIYWADYTLLTIGLGSDYPLKSSLAQGLLIPYASGGIMMIGLIIGSIRGLFLERAKDKVRRRALHKERTTIEREAEDRKLTWEQEFELMRDVQRSADKKRRYWGLGISLLVFLIIWMGGALAFMHSEKRQSWSFLNSLYFAYTTLLTIGYGDFYPMSNSGKPFFVIWSLIAVPSMTILISSMGDTVVEWVKEGTIWVGQKTILPERGENLDMHKSKVFRTPPEVEAEDLRRRSEEKKQHDTDVERNLNTLGTAVEEQEQKHTEKLKNREQDFHKLATIIITEIQELSMHMVQQPPRRYEWEEWRKYLELLNNEDEDEASAEWRWLGDHGPLLSGVSETEWLMAKLCERLQDLLMEAQRKQGKGKGKENAGESKKDK